MPKFTLLEEMQGIAPGVTTIRLRTQKFADNQLFCLQHVAVRDVTTAAKTAEVGLIIGNKTVWIKTLVLTTANVFYTLENQIYVKSCQGVVIDFLSPTANDVLQANVFGYYVD